MSQNHTGQTQQQQQPQPQEQNLLSSRNIIACHTSTTYTIEYEDEKGQPVNNMTTHWKPPSQPTQKTTTNKSKISISDRELREVFAYTQPEAARRLGVSLSTLKRRFYELAGKGKRWPFHEMKKIEKKRSMKYILNETNQPEKMLDPYTLFVLSKTFSGETA